MHASVRGRGPVAGVAAVPEVLPPPTVNESAHKGHKDLQPSSASTQAATTD